MQKAKKTDIPEIKKLLKENDLPIEDLANRIEFYIEKERNQIIVAGGLEPFGNVVILRSVAVSENYKGKGLGAKMTRHLLDASKEQGFSTVFLLTMTAENYFPKFGFIEVDRESAPKEIKSSSEFTTVCPDSAVLMKLEIK